MANHNPDVRLTSPKKWSTSQSEHLEYLLFARAICTALNYTLDDM